MTFEELVLKHNELVAYCAAEDAVHEERMSPFREGVKAILGAILEKLQAEKLKNAPTQYGMAYQYNSTSVKVDNKDTFLQFVIGNDRLDLLDARALKKTVTEFIDKTGQVPPGLNIERNVVARIRDKQTETKA